jgi:hypothetical protein
MPSVVLSRPNKLDHSDTIRYEIDMVRFAAHELEGKKTGRDAWVYLEAFLLHYRNLIDFLGSENPRGTDLHVTNIWQLCALNPPANVNDLYTKGKALRTKYEPRDGQGSARISQYLQHCTMKRIDAKEWEVTVMLNEIEPLLAEIEKHLPQRSFIFDPVNVRTLTNFSASTAVGTHTASGVRLLDQSRLLNSEKPEDF